MKIGLVIQLYIPTTHFVCVCVCADNAICVCADNAISLFTFFTPLIMCKYCTFQQNFDIYTNLWYFPPLHTCGL